MTKVLDLSSSLAPSGLAHYVTNDEIERCDPSLDIVSAASVMVSERHGKFALIGMTECLLQQKATLTARVAELERDLAHSEENNRRIAGRNADWMCRVAELQKAGSRARMALAAAAARNPEFQGDYEAIDAALLGKGEK